MEDDQKKLAPKFQNAITTKINKKIFQIGCGSAPGNLV